VACRRSQWSDFDIRIRLRPGGTPLGRVVPDERHSAGPLGIANCMRNRRIPITRVGDGAPTASSATKMIPYHALPALHEAIKNECPTAYPSLLAAYLEIIPAVLRQVREPGYHVARALPPSAMPALSAKKLV
jgi:hypothetical protein